MPTFRSLSLICGVLIAFSATGFAADELTLDQVPAPVAATFRAQAAGAAIDEIESSTENGATTYEAELKKPTGTVTVEVAADGTLLVTETKGKVSAMPAPVQAAIQKLFATKTPTKGETEVSKDKTVYEVKGMIGSDEVEVQFAADGTELKRTIEKDEEKHGEHDHGNKH